MARHFDVIVIGVGAMGSAACHQLARRGMRVLGLEQFDIPHANGSSHGSSRVVRQAYHEHPDYVPLLKRAYELWRELEAVSGLDLLTITGFLHLGPSDADRLQRVETAAREHALPVECLTSHDVAARFPQFRLDDGMRGVWEPNAGFVRPELAVCAQAVAALECGAVIQAREPVRSWRVGPAGHAVEVTTDRGTYRAEQVIICGGAWSGRLLDERVPLVVTRQVLGWTWPSEPGSFRLGRFPCWSLVRPDGTSHYGFPMLPDNPGFKTAHHWRAAATDPDHVARHELPGDEADVRWPLERYLPSANGPLLALRTCLYTNSPDGHFVVDRHPEHPAVLLACGFSGHGFKFAPAIGEVLAELATGHAPSRSVSFLGLDRFRH